MSSLPFVIFSLAVWRVTYLLVNEEGPANLIKKWRDFSSHYTDVFLCEWCLSVWIGSLASLLAWHLYLFPFLLIPVHAFAFSAITVFITLLIPEEDEDEEQLRDASVVG